MQKVLVFLLVFAITLPSTALAYTEPVQNTVRDHWPTKDQCDAAQVPYTPSITSYQPLGTNEEIRPHPTGGCFLICLPDRETKNYPVRGRGFAYFNPGEPMVYDVSNPKKPVVKRVAKCNNCIDAEPPLDGAVATANMATPKELPKELPREREVVIGPARSSEALVIPPTSSYAVKNPDDRNIVTRNKGKIIAVGVGVVAGAVTLALLKGFKMEQCVFSVCTTK